MRGSVRAVSPPALALTHPFRLLFLSSTLGYCLSALLIAHLRGMDSCGAETQKIIVSHHHRYLEGQPRGVSFTRVNSVRIVASTGTCPKGDTRPHAGSHRFSQLVCARAQQQCRATTSRRPVTAKCAAFCCRGHTASLDKRRGSPSPLPIPNEKSHLPIVNPQG